MNEKNRKRQAEKKRLEQKKMLLQMKKEIESLESKIMHSSLTNAKIGTIRNLKIGARALQLVAPYALTAGIIAGGFILLGNTPFYNGDEWKVYSSVMTEIDNNGNVRFEQQYDNFEDDEGNILDSSDNVLYYYSKWQKNGVGLYLRTVQTYSLENKSYEEVLKLFEKEDLKLEDVLGEPDSNIKETKNNLTEKELQAGPFIKAVVYREDTKDYIMQRETVGENIESSVLYIILTLICELAPLYFRHEHSSFDFLDCIEVIKREHQSLDIETMRKKLELKRENYDRMTR